MVSPSSAIFPVPYTIVGPVGFETTGTYYTIHQSIVNCQGANVASKHAVVNF
jgi:hypothetical protein